MHRCATRVMHVVALVFGLALPAAGQEPRPAPRVAAIAFHDVVDDERDLDPDAVTTDRLVGYLEWIKANGIRPITLDDLDAAARGERALPDRAVLITFDDGYRSLYTRVFPLLLAYRVPAVAFVVGEWMQAPMTATVRYGAAEVSRRKFISWDEAREMAASGLVEFASHSHALHQTVRSDPHGTERPAAIARVYGPQGYETGTAFRQRIAADLARSRELLRKELGRVPRALAWPYGRYRGDSLADARQAGFRFAFSLEPGPVDVASPMTIPRHFPHGNPTLGELVRPLRARAPARPHAFACIDPAALAGNDFEALLGAAIEQVRALGAAAVAIEPFVRGSDGAAVAAWFPTREMPVREDLLTRIAWQLHTRASVGVYLRLPAVPAAPRTPQALQALADDLAASTWIDGVLFEGIPDTALAEAIAREYPAARSQALAGRCLDKTR